MTVTIPDDAIGKMTPEQVRLELAVALFAANKATLARAARIAGLPYLAFQRELGRRQIPMHYGLAEYEADMRTLERLKYSDRR
jgi:predicted HTH domain antitoxin